MESPSGRLHRLALQELYGEPQRTLDELVARVDAVTAEETAEVAAEFLDPEGWLKVRLGPTQ
jgi:predicted Zn-dependent peptidase